MPKYDGNVFDLQLNRKKGFSEHRIKVIFHQLYLALKEMHSKGWAHRDLKLENIMYVKKPFKIKLADFGLSTNTFPSHRKCGTTGYRSAECSQKLEYDPKKNDIWSLAAVLVKLVSGINPFQEDFIQVKDAIEKNPKKMRVWMSEYASKWKISDELSMILAKVFVPEKNRINLNQFYEQVMDTKHLRRYMKPKME